jgi:hypothetical protein
MKKNIIISIAALVVLSGVAAGSYWLGASSRRGAVGAQKQEQAEVKSLEAPKLYDIRGIIKSVNKDSIVLEDDSESREFREREAVIVIETEMVVNVRKSEQEIADSQRKMEEESKPFNEKMVINEKKILDCPNSLVASVPAGFNPGTPPPSGQKAEETPECKILREEHQELVEKLNDIYLKYFQEFDIIKPAKIGDFKVGDKVSIRSKAVSGGGFESLVGKERFEAGSIQSWR